MGRFLEEPNITKIRIFVTILNFELFLFCLVSNKMVAVSDWQFDMIVCTLEIQGGQNTILIQRRLLVSEVYIMVNTNYFVIASQKLSFQFLTSIPKHILSYFLPTARHFDSYRPGKLRGRRHKVQSTMGQYKKSVKHDFKFTSA